jgi:hypothetical protein
MTHGKTWVTLLSGLLILSCGGTPPVEQEAASAAEGPDTTQKALLTVADPCGGLDDSEAAALLEIPAEELERKVLGEAMDNACALSSRESMRKQITFVLREEASVAVAEREFGELKGGFASVVTGDPVEGLGDEAIWFGEKGPVVFKRLLVRKSNVWLDVVGAPGGLEGSSKVAQVVLRKLS